MHGMDYEAKLPGVWNITLNHNPDWSGEVFITWLDAEPPSNPSLFPSQGDIDWQSSWLRKHQTEFTVDGKELIRGRARVLTVTVDAQRAPLANYEIPPVVLTLATWLAVNHWWQGKIVGLAEDSWAGGYK